MGALVIGWPQGIYLALTLFGLGVVVAKHGKPREAYDATITTIGTALILGLLYWGGFFG